MSTAEEILAKRLFDARRTAMPISAIRGEMTAGDIPAAYRIQKANIERLVAAGARRVGRKIGLTSKAVQAQLGVDQPDFGVLLDSMKWEGDEVAIPLAGLIAPRIEAAIAFFLKSDITKKALGRDELEVCIAGVSPAAEIVDSAIKGWDIKILDTVADNASSGRFAIGTVIPFKLSDDLPRRAMRLLRNGTVVSSGAGAASLGDPLTALSWLADVSIDFGDPLRAGEVILSGALGPMVPFEPAEYRIEIDGFGPLVVKAYA